MLHIVPLTNKKPIKPKLDLETVRKSVQLFSKLPAKKKLHIGEFNFKSFDLRDSTAKNVLKPSVFSPTMHRINFFDKQQTGTISRNKHNDILEHLSSGKNIKHKI